MGRSGEAQTILFHAYERRRAALSGWQWVGSTLSLAIIGHGCGWRVFFSLGWALLLVVVGWAVIRRNGEVDERFQRLGVVYSLDMLIPVLRLREDNYRAILKRPWSRRYFAVHRTTGYVLATFMIAGIAGLVR